MTHTPEHSQEHFSKKEEKNLSELPTQDYIQAVKEKFERQWEKMWGGKDSLLLWKSEAEYFTKLKD